MTEIPPPRELLSWRRVDLLDALAELLLVRATRRAGRIRDHDEPPLLGRDPDGIDVSDWR